MARVLDRLPENAPGDWFVDASCIDCDACRQIAPTSFAQSEREQSYVSRQPATDEERCRAAMALVACPTSSIGTANKREVAAAVRAFPEPLGDDIRYCGFTSESSFGASSYLIVRPQGNVLVDSPRAARPLMQRIAELGGVATMFLTHRDDVADHAKFRAVFGCERILHLDDVSHDTASVERKLEGTSPIRLSDDLVAIPVPGHTRGSTALLYKDVALFSGDHVWYSAEARRLHASRSVCWYSWAEQTRSVERLLDYRFQRILPGHGRRYQAESASEMTAELARLLAWMRGS
jgi:glyoxylase-like metal-dependent hydrolase (beta-lactamase superfamily II)/ferredoxin